VYLQSLFKLESRSWSENENGGGSHVKLAKVNGWRADVVSKDSVCSPFLEAALFF
jgi:hypothetical protein